MMVMAGVTPVGPKHLQVHRVSGVDSPCLPSPVPEGKAGLDVYDPPHLARQYALRHGADKASRDQLAPAETCARLRC